MLTKNSLLSQFKNHSQEYIIGAIDMLEGLPIIGKPLESIRDFFNKKSLIKFDLDQNDTIKIYAPENFDKDDWKDLILSKLDVLKTISNAHICLQFWYSEHLEGKFSPQEAMKFMRENDVPLKSLFEDDGPSHALILNT